jgi:hypothetical protein
VVFSSANFINSDNYNLEKLAKYLISLKLKANPLFMLYLCLRKIWGTIKNTIFALFGKYTLKISS